MANLLSNPDLVGAGAPTLLVAPAAVAASGPSAAPSWTVASSTPGATSQGASYKAYFGLVAV